MKDKGLCIIPCGSAKIWDQAPQAGPQHARNVYTGVLSKACKRYAERFFDHWVILSAKHGFLFPDDIVEAPYDVSFVKPSAQMITIDALLKQAKDKSLSEFSEITVLGGQHYTSRIKRIFTEGQALHFPLSDCKGIGYMLQRLSNALRERKSS
ncbi:DUF6884 domain-containing protein [Cohnella sp. GCM10012308]|uniref:DUF6884 domain-containing protein n=1 Tax=Cohnella sp. GCM10012308 TaxID=3317329 RepID=UPI003609A471